MVLGVGKILCSLSNRAWSITLYALYYSPTDRDATQESKALARTLTCLTLHYLPLPYPTVPCLASPYPTSMSNRDATQEARALARTLAPDPPFGRVVARVPLKENINACREGDRPGMEKVSVIRVCARDSRCNGMSNCNRQGWRR